MAYKLCLDWDFVLNTVRIEGKRRDQTLYRMSPRIEMQIKFGFAFSERDSHRVNTNHIKCYIFWVTIGLSMGYSIEI